jgi:LuxR family maltose regulon positive regulatory protein
MTVVPNLTRPVDRWWDGEPRAALDAIEASLRRGDTSFALSLVRSVRRRLGESDVHLTADRFRLTERELSVLSLLPDATLSQKDIARAMGITGNTLKTHLRSVYQKLGAHSRAEAIEIAGMGRTVLRPSQRRSGHSGAQFAG